VDAVVAAVVSAVTAVAVTFISVQLSGRQQRRGEERAERREVNARYLNPLRLHLVENHFRLSEILRRADPGDGRVRDLLVVQEPAEVSAKDAAWFNGVGCYLVSSSYLTACLFAQLKEVREDIPFLRLSGADDTRLAQLMLQVHRGFLADGGIYYVTQPSIGEDLWIRDEARLRTYREFCQLLEDPGARVWLDRLLSFYLETGRGEKRGRVEHAVAAMGELAEFLDGCVGGGRAITMRWESEGGS
jgi:hypothetical protein